MIGDHDCKRMPVTQGPIGGAESSLDALLQAREDAFRAMELGGNEMAYRGHWIDIEDDEAYWGWTYLLDGVRYGEPLEAVFEEIDERAGPSQEEIEALSEAWGAHLEVRELRTGKPGLDAVLRARVQAVRAMEEGEDLIDYRGRSVGIEGEECVYNDARYPSMEDAFDAIDLEEGLAGLEAEELERAWSVLSESL